MARVPITFYLSIFAGLIVLFNHFASSETGDVALNKVTGAAGRFYTLFRDTALTFHRGCTARLETALCGPTVDTFLPHDAVEYVRVHFCHASMEDSDVGDGGGGVQTSGRQSNGGYGGSDGVVSVHYQPRIRPLGAEELLGQPPLRFGLDGSSKGGLSRAVWDWSSEVMVTVGLLLFRTWASWWWFRAPLRVTGVVLTAYAVLSVLGYVFGAGMVLRVVSQVCMAVVVDFLRCIQWEAQRQALDIGVVLMVCVYGAAKHARR